MAKAIPDGYHSLTPQITVKDAEKAIEFYKKAFGAKEIMRMPGPGGKGIMHAELKIGDSAFMLADEMPAMGAKSPQSLGGSTGSIYLYVEDVDSVYAKALAAGGTGRSQVQDMFWGDRTGHLTDPFGHQWTIATHKEDVSMAEMGKRAQAFFSKMSASGA